MPTPVFRTLVFDRNYGEQLKRQGIDLSISTRMELVRLARTLAYGFAKSRRSRTATIDDVTECLGKLGYKPDQLGNAAGGIFKVGEWEFVGWEQSRRATNHRRAIRVWRLR